MLRESIPTGIHLGKGLFPNQAGWESLHFTWHLDFVALRQKRSESLGSSPWSEFLLNSKNDYLTSSPARLSQRCGMFKSGSPGLVL